MQSMPLLFRQSLRYTANFTRNSSSVRTPLLSALSPKALPVDRRRGFSVCLQCQFRSQSAFSLSHETDKQKDDKPANRTKDGEPSAVPEGILKAEADAGSQGSSSVVEGGGIPRSDQPEQGGKNDAEPNGSRSGGLPSYLENRRSQFSKQFTAMMDNLQSNIFVAGQRLNDLTGYSGIEALKKEIHSQEERLRAARFQVRQAKDAYSSAINRRSTSQREVNELLQRKHAWSPADLERFTHLYRNDHANEVAESETQEALSVAERESEEAAAQLSRSILSRYHEEQVWSDKIRQMSTWGTWGLMGVNVLLFLIFQIAVEPWRRKRLVKGFEEKVIEALEKEKTITQAQTLSSQEAVSQQLPVTPISHEMGESPVASPFVVQTPAEESTHGNIPAVPAENTEPATDPTPATMTDATTNGTTMTAMNSTIESCKSQISGVSSLPSVETWGQYFYDLFSDRSFVITQRDLSTIAIQSAAAGAAVMGLVIALIRQQ